MIFQRVVCCVCDPIVCLGASLHMSVLCVICALMEFLCSILCLMCSWKLFACGVYLAFWDVRFVCVENDVCEDGVECRRKQPLVGPAASFSVHLTSSAVTPAESVHKSRDDNSVRMLGAVKMLMCGRGECSILLFLFDWQVILRHALNY